MAAEKPIAHIDFELLGFPNNVVEYMAAHPEIRQMFRDYSKHADRLVELKDEPLQQRLQYVKDVSDAFELIFKGNDGLEGVISIATASDSPTNALDKYVLDAYLAEDNWETT